MKLQDCCLDVKGIVTGPLVFTRADEEWTKLKDEKLIPVKGRRQFQVA
jgi:hypothetical protein